MALAYVSRYLDVKCSECGAPAVVLTCDLKEVADPDFPGVVSLERGARLAFCAKHQRKPLVTKLDGTVEAT